MLKRSWIQHRFVLTLKPVLPRLQGSNPFCRAIQASRVHQPCGCDRSLDRGRSLQPGIHEIAEGRMTRLQWGSTFKRRWPLASRIIGRVALTLSRMLWDLVVP